MAVYIHPDGLPPQDLARFQALKDGMDHPATLLLQALLSGNLVRMRSVGSARALSSPSFIPLPPLLSLSPSLEHVQTS
jgi:hypothetical protein